MLGAGVAVGYVSFILIPDSLMAPAGSSAGTKTLIGMMAGGGLLGFFIAPVFTRKVLQIARQADSHLRRVPMNEIVAGALGVIVGLIIANLLAIPVASLPIVGSYLGIVLNLMMGYLGLFIAVRKREDIMSLVGVIPRAAEGARVAARERGGRALPAKPQYKILDTSVIIDGRIADIAKSGFIEGVLIIPGFVLEELQHIADSSDVLKRNRGRRGLDILNRIQKDQNVSVQIVDKYFDDPEVDTKLIRLARVMDAKILTNDFNLNKVAELHGVRVLNINELANALKPVVLPGEEMMVHVIKDGKESGQGVGYLDDGTMVVVDGGRRYIGDSVGVLVTSVLQTSAGRMIFAKPKSLDRAV
jgi:uncharacterized protein YacL